MSAPPMRRLGVSMGKLPTFNDGLGEFSWQLGQGLAARAPALAEQHGLQITFHMRRGLHGCFGDQVSYLDTAHWQRWWHHTRPAFDVWHSVHQHNHYRVPRNAKWCIQTIHDLNFFYLKSPEKARRYARQTQALLDRADEVVTISEFVRQDIVQRLSPRSPVQVIYNGAHDLSGHEQSALPGVTTPFFLHLSRMAPSKNVDAILALAAHWPQTQWVLAGGRSPYSDELQSRIQAMGLRNVQVHLDITPAQKAWAYAHCEAFVFPSLAEGFGLPPIEAMQFGKPVFLSTCTCLPEIGGAWAHYFSDFSPPAMQATMEAGLQQWQQQGDRAALVRAHARSFDWQRTVDAYVALYLRGLHLPSTSEAP